MAAVDAHPDRQLEHLFADHAQAVYRYALRLTRDSQEAEDATQTTFLRAWRSLCRGATARTPRSWLLAIAHNVCNSSFRDRGRDLPLDLADHSDPRQAGDGDRPDIAALVGAIGMLPENQRQALVMRELEGRPYQEIAAALQVTVSAVETLLFRARRTLRRQRDNFQLLLPVTVFVRRGRLAASGPASAAVKATAFVCCTMAAGGAAIGVVGLPGQAAAGTSKPAAREFLAAGKAAVHAGRRSLPAARTHGAVHGMAAFVVQRPANPESAVATFGRSRADEDGVVLDGRNDPGRDPHERTSGRDGGGQPAGVPGGTVSHAGAGGTSTTTTACAGAVGTASTAAAGATKTASDAAAGATKTATGAGSDVFHGTSATRAGADAAANAVDATSATGSDTAAAAAGTSADATGTVAQAGSGATGTLAGAGADVASVLP